MSKDDVAARLKALAADDKRRSETARLREVFDEVEATLGAGVSQADVLEELHGAGFKMTLASFKSALQRIRKERQSKKPEKTVERQKEGATERASDTAEKTAAPGKFEKKQSKTFGHSAKSDGINDLLK